MRAIFSFVMRVRHRSYFSYLNYLQYLYKKYFGFLKLMLGVAILGVFLQILTTPFFPRTYTISGFVYGDQNRDGVKNSQELGYATVPLLLSGGNLTESVMIDTDAQGYFSYQIHDAGVYQLAFQNPEGTELTGENGQTVTIEVNNQAREQEVNFGTTPSEKNLAINFNSSQPQIVLQASSCGKPKCYGLDQTGTVKCYPNGSEEILPGASCKGNKCNPSTGLCNSAPPACSSLNASQCNERSDCWNRWGVGCIPHSQASKGIQCGGTGSFCALGELCPNGACVRTTECRSVNSQASCNARSQCGQIFPNTSCDTEGTGRVCCLAPTQAPQTSSCAQTGYPVPGTIKCRDDKSYEFYYYETGADGSCIRNSGQPIVKQCDPNFPVCKDGQCQKTSGAPAPVTCTAAGGAPAAGKPCCQGLTTVNGKCATSGSPATGCTATAPHKCGDGKCYKYICGNSCSNTPCGAPGPVGGTTGTGGTSAPSISCATLKGTCKSVCPVGEYDKDPNGATECGLTEFCCAKTDSPNPQALTGASCSTNWQGVRASNGASICCPGPNTRYGDHKYACAKNPMPNPSDLKDPKNYDCSQTACDTSGETPGGTTPGTNSGTGTNPNSSNNCTAIKNPATCNKNPNCYNQWGVGCSRKPTNAASELVPCGTDKDKDSVAYCSPGRVCKKKATRNAQGQIIESSNENDEYCTTGGETTEDNKTVACGNRKCDSLSEVCYSYSFKCAANASEGDGSYCVSRLVEKGTLCCEGSCRGGLICAKSQENPGGPGMCCTPDEEYKDGSCQKKAGDNSSCGMEHKSVCSTDPKCKGAGLTPVSGDGGEVCCREGASWNENSGKCINTSVDKKCGGADGEYCPLNSYCYLPSSGEFASNSETNLDGGYCVPPQANGIYGCTENFHCQSNKCNKETKECTESTNNPVGDTPPNQGGTSATSSASTEIPATCNGQRYCCDDINACGEYTWYQEGNAWKLKLCKTCDEAVGNLRVPGSPSGSTSVSCACNGDGSCTCADGNACTDAQRSTLSCGGNTPTGATENAPENTCGNWYCDGDSDRAGGCYDTECECPGNDLNYDGVCDEQAPAAESSCNNSCDSLSDLELCAEDCANSPDDNQNGLPDALE